jgi:peptide/nickel transport system permease protein
MSSKSGRTGAAFFIMLVVVSLYVIVAYPLDFGSRLWNNPAEWADNPKNVPPAWTSVFSGIHKVNHTIFNAEEPSVSETVNGQTFKSYSFEIDYDYDESPTFTSWSISEVTFNERSPVISLTITRPDGKELLLLRHVVPGPSAAESLPITRYAETPFRIFLSGDNTVLFNVSDFLSQEFGLNIDSADLRGHIDEVIFGVPDETGTDFSVLKGTYTVTTATRFTHPDDSIGQVGFVLGGSVYGFMGTDSQGRDLATGLLFGFPIALLIGLSTAIATTIIGTFMGITSGYLGGKTDTLIQRSSDILANIPLLPILIFFAFIIGQKLWLVIVVLIAFGWPGLTILVRSMVLHYNSSQLVESTRALGASRMRIMFRHVLFQIAPFVLAQMIFFTPGAILAEAGLSFLGLGDPSIPTWGQILESGFSTGAVYTGYWWWVLPPGLLVVLAAMTFVLLTLGLEPIVNPRLRK